MEMDRIKIVIDAMGGDNSPWAMVEGAVLATKEHADVFLYIVGPRTQIEAELAKYEEQIDLRTRLGYRFAGKYKKHSGLL